MVADIFKIKGKKAGSDVILVPGIRVTSGKIAKSARVYIFRNNTPITGEMYPKSIKCFKK